VCVRVHAFARLVFDADRRISPDIGAIEERVPRLDPLRGRAERSGDGGARVVGLAGVGLGARLRVGGGERGHADAERRAGPDVRAGHVAVQLLDLARGERELGLDGHAAVREGGAGGKWSHKEWCVRRTG
jgi:hypothetical protein